VLFNKNREENIMELSSIPLVIASGVALVGTSLLWCRKKRILTGSRRTKKTSTSVTGFSEAQAALELEMEHARRLEYKLAIIVIQELDPAESRVAAANDESDTREENGGTETSIVDVLRNTSLLKETLRMIDIVAYDEDRQFVMGMLPGVDNAHAAHTALRIRKQLHLEPNEGVQIGCAEFPGDGLLLDDLISSALSRMGQSESVVRIHPRTQLDATKQ
jgi:hypothetical protein